MLRRSFVLFALVVAAFAVTTSATSASKAKIGPAGLSTKVAPFDQQFIDMMAAHHQMAITMARMAGMGHGKHSQVAQLARRIIAAQSAEIRQFQALRKRWYGNATFRTYAGNEMMMRSMGMAAGDMNGMMQSSQFDYAFLSSMIPHHAGAITMARWEEQAGTHAELRKIAMKIVRDQAKEIGQMIGWRVAWYGS